MRFHLLACTFALAACGSDHSGGTVDAPDNGGGDGAMIGDSLGGNPQTVTVTLTNHPTDATTYGFIAAYQDGASAWQVAPAPTGDTYSFTVNSPVWGFAWTCAVPNTQIARVELAYFTIAERNSLTEEVPPACTDRDTPSGVTGTVQNLPGSSGGVYRAVYAQSRPGFVGSTSGNFGVEGPTGPHDLFITHQTGGGGGFTTDAVARTTATAPATGVTVNWTTSKAVATAAITAPANTLHSTTLYSAGNTKLQFSLSTTPTMVGLAASQATSGDIYVQTMIANGTGANEVAEAWTTTVGVLTFTMPPALGGAISTVPTTMPYPVVSTMWNSYTSGVGYIWDAQQGPTTGTTSPLEWTALLGAGYLGSSPHYQIPDLSQLAGWSASYQFQTGSQIRGTVSALTSSAGAGDFPTVQPAAAGTTRTLASSSWTVTP